MRDRQPLGSSPYLVTVRDRTYTEVTSAAGYTSMDLKLVYNGISEWTLKLHGEHPAAPLLAEKGAGIVVRPIGSDTVILSGLMKSADHDVSVGEGGEISDEWVISGVSDEYQLLKEFVYPDPTIDVSTSALVTFPVTHEENIGVPAETAIKNLVTANVSNNAGVPRRRYGWLSVEPDLARGDTVRQRDRFSTLLETIQASAEVGDIGFKMRQTSSGRVTFSVWMPAVRPEARWSPQAKNIRGFTHSIKAPECDDALVGDGGDGTARQFLRSSDQTSQQEWAMRSCGFVDQSSSVLADMRQAGQVERAEGSAVAGLSIHPFETPGLRYGVHYELGDIGTASIGSVTVTDRIVQVTIQHSSGAPVVTPSVGTADGSQTPAWLKPVQKLSRKVGLLGRH